MIQAYEIDKNVLAENTKPNKDGFTKMVIKGVEYTEKEDAGKAILKACSEKQSKEKE